MNETFYTFCQSFTGKRIFKRNTWNGSTHEIEIPRYQLYWAGISYNEIINSENYVLRNRKKIKYQQ